MRATAAAARKLATIEVVDSRGGVAILGCGVGTTRGGGSVVGRLGGGAQVLADGVGQVGSIKSRWGDEDEGPGTERNENT